MSTNAGDYGRITDRSLADVQGSLGVERVERGWTRVATADAIWHFAPASATTIPCGGIRTSR
jgi:hypothetical protein